MCSNSDVVALSGPNQGLMGIPSDRIAAVTPNVENLNITKSSRVQIGPKFVSVTQNLHNAEMVKGSCLCVELVTAAPTGGVRCAIAVFVVWAALVAAGLTVYLVFVILPTQRIRLDIGLNAEWYLRRADWQAMAAYKVTFRDLPLKYVIIGHSALNYCDKKYQCIEEVLSIQNSHLKRRYDDIGPNYLVGGNGYVFEGRGADVSPAMVKTWNERSLTIMFLGNYQVATPDQAQFDNVNELLATLVREGVLVEDYMLYGHCQIAAILSPGAHVLAHLDSFSQWSRDNLSACPIIRRKFF